MDKPAAKIGSPSLNLRQCDPQVCYLTGLAASKRHDYPESEFVSDDVARPKHQAATAYPGPFVRTFGSTR